MPRPLLALAIAASLAVSSAARADDAPKQLARDEVAAIKHTLVAIADALGLPKTGYTAGKDQFGLPTDYATTDGGFLPTSSDVTRNFVAAAKTDAQKSQKDLQTDYQKKILDAQSRGDYAEVARLGQELAGKANGVASQAIQAESFPDMLALIHLNTGYDQTVDPDNVLAEAPGVIALKTTTTLDNDNHETVRVYFDPIGLKDSKKVSRIAFDLDKALKTRTKAIVAMIELQGPPPDVEAWAKKFDKEKVLALLR